MLKYISGFMPMKEDIRSAFEADAPLVKNIASFALPRTLCEGEAYMAITATDDDVYTCIIAIMEANPMGNDKAAINTGPGATAEGQTTSGS